MEHTAASLYSQLESQRYTFLDRARECSKLTLPHLVPPSGYSASTILDTPFQGIGSRGVNNLSSKLLLSLLPPNSPFFRLVVDTYTLKQMEGMEDVKTEIESALAEVERSVMAEIETSNLRSATFEAIRHLIVAGNVLLYLPDDGGVRVFHLDEYVIERDPMGNVENIVIKECVSPLSLPEEVRDVVGKQMAEHEKVVDLYTCIHRDGERFAVYQEVKGMRIPGSDGYYALDKSPWIPLRWNRVSGDSYGRGMVEEYLGDLRSLEALTQAIVEGSAAAAKVLFLVAPNGTTRLRTLAEAGNGAICEGNAADVTTLQLNKFNDFRVALETINQIRDRLGYSFLLNTSIQRQGERVTATEIRMMAQELEDALGGVYSTLSQEFQLPLVNRIMSKMQKAKRLPKLPKELIRPVVVTGLEALGRGHDLTKLDVFISGMAQALGPQALPQFLNLRAYMERRATAIGLDTKGLVKTEEQMAAEQQQAQMMSMAQSLGPGAIQGMSRMGVESMKQQQMGAPTE